MLLVVCAGGQGGMSNAALPTLWGVQSTAGMVRMRQPLIPSPLSVYTVAAFAFSSCWTICSVVKEGSVVLSPKVVRTEFGFFCVIWLFVDANFVDANVYPLLLKNTRRQY
jgi:hypothetical protein